MDTTGNGNRGVTAAAGRQQPFAGAMACSVGVHAGVLILGVAVFSGMEPGRSAVSAEPGMASAIMVELVAADATPGEGRAVAQPSDTAPLTPEPPARPDLAAMPEPLPIPEPADTATLRPTIEAMEPPPFEQAARSEPDSVSIMPDPLSERAPDAPAAEAPLSVTLDGIEPPRRPRPILEAEKRALPARQIAALSRPVSETPQAAVKEASEMPMPTNNMPPTETAMAVLAPEQAGSATTETVAPPRPETGAALASAPAVAAKTTAEPGPAGDAATIWRNAPLMFVPRFNRAPEAPAYPSRAVNRGDEGEVVLRVRVDTRGRTREIIIYRSSGHSLLDRAAQAAAERWQFAPAPLAGGWQEAWVQIPVMFRLN